ncbi:GNAT family N-acetyltransferase [Streptomyces sp. DT2A-34]|uniref:GNAT family N-acetyltransferase n=1 Tax=Streptomyces sp. DT2A-34 TaxID=3051182 RepID=UPI00265C6EA6|nr:GNAT family N-acetyltransferase [Streptomyces sp. DT2A-34]MDO0909352.1 GNAT family N-acetyltransferase [Streptomyces sp. DT2A-34]
MDDSVDLGEFVVRRASESESDALVVIDAVAVEGDVGRQASIRKWCQQGLVVVAEDASGLLGYCVVEYTFFEQGLVTMLMVAPSARGRGVGHRLLNAVAASCTNPQALHLDQRLQPADAATASTSRLEPGRPSPRPR